MTAFFDDQYRQHNRYWWREEWRYSTEPEHHRGSVVTAALLRLLHLRSPGRALDVGAGEGADAIRLARMGYEVDAVEASEVGAEKIERFARSAGVHVNVIHGDAMVTRLAGEYEVVQCNGLLHYVEDKAPLIDRLQRATVPGGLTVVSLFTDATPVPDCHRLVDVFPDAEEGEVAGAFCDWEPLHVWAERDKPERNHPGLPPHAHSFLKLIAEKRHDHGFTHS